MITAVFFDLDGTLLPMDQDKFIEAYIGGMCKKMAPHGYDPKRLAKAVWVGTGAMTANDGTVTNDEVFWKAFNSAYGDNCRKDEHLFNAFYRNEFQEVAKSCGFDQRAKEVIGLLKDKGIRRVLATNPLFPAIATQSRVRWAGLEPEDFEHITTYENSAYCKPNPDYYREILGKLNLKAEECLMVGNDVAEDMAAAQVGMQVFLLTDCMINRHKEPIEKYPHGGFDALLDTIRRL